MFFVSVAVAGCNFFIPSTLGVVLFSVSMGFLLSLDLSQISTLCCAGPRPASGGSLGRRRGAAPSPPGSFGWRLGCREALLYLGLLAAAVAEAGLLHHFLAADPPQSPAVTRQRLPIIASYLLLSLFLLCWVLGEIQGAYVCGGVFLNPFYPRGISNVQSFIQSSRGLHVAAVTRRVLLNLGESPSHNVYLMEQNLVYSDANYWLLSLISVSPFAMIAYLSTDKSLQWLHTASLSVGFTRAFRVVKTMRTQRNAYNASIKITL